MSQKLDIEFDFSILQHINPYQMQSWADVIVWCAANGQEPTMDMYKYFLLGSFFSKSISKMLHHTLTKTNFLDDLANSIEGAEAAYVISRNATRTSIYDRDYNYNHKADRWEYARKWYDFNDSIIQQPPEDAIIEDYPYNVKHPMFDKMRIDFWKLMDLKFPLLWLKLFAKWKSTINLENEEFVAFLLTRTKMKANLDKRFESVFQTLLKECMNRGVRQMHIM